MGKYTLGALIGSIITFVVIKYNEWQEDKIDEPWFVRSFEENNEDKD